MESGKDIKSLVLDDISEPLNQPGKLPGDFFLCEMIVLFRLLLGLLLLPADSILTDLEFKLTSKIKGLRERDKALMTLP